MKKVAKNIPSPVLACLAFVLLASFMVGCTGKKTTIGKNGLHAIKLGDDLPPPGAEELKGIPLRDTLFEDSAYTWRASIMEYKEGTVYLEQDFFGSEVLNRIRIQTPELKLKNGLRVGKTVADLKKIKAEWYISPLADYKLFEFYTQVFPTFHFLVSAPGADMSETDWRKYSMDAFQDEAKIVAIVLF